MTAIATKHATAEVIERMPFVQYAASPEPHATALRHLLVSPLAYRRAMEAERTETDAMRLGRATHTAVFEPMQFLREYVLWEGGRRFGKAWDEFCDANSDKTILTQDQYELALRVQQSVRNHKVAGKYLSERGKAELSIRWTDPRTGVRIKARIDWIASAIADLKTTKSPSPAQFSVSAARYGYAMQMALYADGACVAGFGALPRKLIAAQTAEPFDVVVYDIDDETHAIGVRQYERALDLLVECTRSKQWPGQAPDEEVTLRLPMWAASDYEESSADSSAPIEDASF